MGMAQAKKLGQHEDSGHRSNPSQHQEQIGLPGFWVVNVGKCIKCGHVCLLYTSDAADD